ncbi:amidohydrolase family protein [Fodinicola feengrottensis]|uniref:amidohydrolase family protein n=1 Tax=Fodinicola feengrottensis TaxID=435914 RepID=UPI002441878D|nr:amidohydrolase family protein [Fodinicola feengrottensis]
MWSATPTTWPPAKPTCGVFSRSLDSFVGVKIHTGYPRREITSPQMRDLFALMNNFDAVVLIHSWGPDVLDLARLVDTNPRLRVIAAHMGADRWDLAAQAARDRDRLYLEPSGSVTDAGQVAYVAARVRPEQLLFGTDATLIDPAVSFGLVQDAGLTPAVAEAMYWRNAAELFGLGGAVQAVSS